VIVNVLEFDAISSNDGKGISLGEMEGRYSWDGDELLVGHQNERNLTTLNSNSRGTIRSNLENVLFSLI